jgi:hypothetical protein
MFSSQLPNQFQKRTAQSGIAGKWRSRLDRPRYRGRYHHIVRLCYDSTSSGFLFDVKGSVLVDVMPSMLWYCA